MQLFAPRRLGAAIAATVILITPCARAQPAPPSPADRLGALFADVQMQRIFPDQKSFADAIAKRPDAAILSEYAAGHFDRTELAAFVQANFDPPADPPPTPMLPQGLTLSQHIDALWPALTRTDPPQPAASSLLPLAHPYVVPGGRFREIYYWDSYFTMLGLVRAGRGDLVEAMIDDFTGLIERYGHIPNGTRSYYLSRSQPPFYFAMVALSQDATPAVRLRRLRAMQREHEFWMRGAAGVRVGSAAARVVRLADGTLLNRYADDRATPRDESWREDVLTARAAAPRAQAQTWNDLRAAAESGWDFSSRWLGDPQRLGSIRTGAIVPVDLNSLLFGLERAIAAGCATARDNRCAADYARIAASRQRAIGRVLWDARAARFADYDWQRGHVTRVASAAMLYPLFVGAATPAQAAATARFVERFLIAPGGLRTTLAVTGQQWDRPNGWAPLQWIAVSGLRRYGDGRLAQRIADGWIATVTREYRASGRLLEKYDVERAVPGGGGEYALQDGFGWTNGVTRELLTRRQADAGAGPAPR